jgi:hypothetical protein
MYGLEPDRRCNASLAYGLEFDHVILEANSHDNSLENCACVCPLCHDYKTRHHDTPLAAKTLRQQDKHLGIEPRHSHSFSCGRNRKWKKKLNGKVERR